MSDRPTTNHQPSATDQRPTSDHNRILRLWSERIPHAMRELDHWVGADADKVPFNPATGGKASPTDPATWGTFAQAEAFARRRDLDIGFGLTLEVGIVCIDLDHCRDPETGIIEAWAQTIVDRVASYTESSRSGTGLHIYAIGTLPPSGRRRGPIEMYNSGRYVIVTGQPLPGRDVLRERTATLTDLHRETFPAPPPTSPPTSTIPLQLDDNDILECARRSEKFRRLYDGGDMTDYADNWSDADLGELCHLVRAGADTPEQLDRIHRAGALMREKWETRRGTSTYGETTISKALDGRVTPVRPAPPPSKTATCGDGQTTGTELPDDVPGLKALIVDLTRRVAAAEKRADVAEKRAAMLSEVQSKATGIVGNGKLRNARSTGLVLSYLFANREAAGETGPQAINQKEMAKRAGCSDDALAKHLDLFDREGVIRKRTDWVPGEWVDADGVLHDGRRQVIIEPVGSAMTFVDNLVMLDPIRLKRDGTADKGWGGARECRDHPGAEVVITSEASCGVCGKRLGALKSERFDTLTAAAEALDIESTEEGASPQHAVIPRTSVVNHISRDSRTYHNDDAPPDSIAGAWQRGAALPGFDPSPPVDRWTG